MSRVRVVLADDHPVIRDGLRAMMADQPDLHVVGDAGDGPAAIRAAKDSKADVVLLDLSMPGAGGVTTLERLIDTCPDTKVLVVTMHNDVAYLRAALAAGAAGYVIKTTPVADLLAAVRAVAAGRRVIDPALAGQLDNLTPGGLGDLSRREREVLDHLVRGHTHQEIADKLNVSVKTIETYRARIREKTGLKTRADLVRYGLEAGLLQQDSGATDRP
jgi:DNA-binding NarL/FixJ family response regulator